MIAYVNQNHYNSVIHINKDNIERIVQLLMTRLISKTKSKPTIERQQEEQDDQEEQHMDVKLEAEELQDAAEMNVPDELPQPMVNVPNQEQQPGYVNLESDIQSEVEF